MTIECQRCGDSGTVYDADDDDGNTNLPRPCPRCSPSAHAFMDRTRPDEPGQLIACWQCDLGPEHPSHLIAGAADTIKALAALLDYFGPKTDDLPDLLDPDFWEGSYRGRPSQEYLDYWQTINGARKALGLPVHQSEGAA